ncbi:MAG: DNA methyltransferase [Polyangiaceae bacterium]|jgi:type II restriction/modification system DNA methylase subunit YeeA
MSENLERLRAFVAYGEKCASEKSDAQVFLERLFIAFGHKGFKDAGATLEFDVRGSDGRVKWADLIWKPRVLIEMKKRGEKLQRHYQQAFDYWLEAVPNRPRYVVLCNFAEFWIYDFGLQLREPVDRVRLEELPHRFDALNFLYPDDRPPKFGNDRVAVTREAANWIATIFNSMRSRGEQPARAQRFLLQCVVAMFSEDLDLIPDKLFSQLVDECVTQRKSTFDLLGGLFQRMNTSEPARGGRYKDVPYFNGGLFAVIDPIELNMDELVLLGLAAERRWAKIEPPIFGTLFQNSMDKEERHALGAHFTNEAEIARVIGPTIVRPFRERIASASTAKELTAIRQELLSLRVLDPACGSGNFLYTAFREMKRLELEIIARVRSKFQLKTQQQAKTAHVSLRQFFGIDKDSFAVELAKVELLLAKKLAIDEAEAFIEKEQLQFDEVVDRALPLDNLEANILCDDALFCAWPQASVIIGNPPYQSKNKAQAEFGAAYMNRVRKRHPGVPGLADYCVYWFRRAHDELAEGGRAGLVGTNTIRENKSRVGGLDYIVAHGGTITEAVSTQVWPGEAVLHVSIVNWIKGTAEGNKTLWVQDGDGVDAPWEKFELPVINSALSTRVDVTMAKDLACNEKPKTFFQGQTPGHTKGFVIPKEKAEQWIASDKRNADILFPYMIGDDLLDNEDSSSERKLLDFGDRDLVEASRYKLPFAHVQAIVLPDREKALAKEQQRSEEAREDDPNAHVNKHHANFMKRWWKLSYRREDMLEALAEIPRYIVCSRVTRRPIFEFVSKDVRPGDALQVFAFADDYSFGILQSDIHWQWFVERCSGLKVDPRYTSETVYATFPWPQTPTAAQARALATASAALRKFRRAVIRKEKICLRQLYRLLELPGEHPVKEAQKKLDDAVRAAYGMRAKADPLRFLLELNEAVAAKEAKKERVQGPGLPGLVGEPRFFISDDCVSF